MKDLLNRINPRVGLVPQVQTNASGAMTGPIIDKKGYESVTFVIATGTLTDANATFAVTMEHGDDPALADTSAPAATDLVGALPTFDFSADIKCFKVGYIGNKRYTRITITSTGNDAGAAPVAVVAILGHPHQWPTDNPPT